MKRRILGVSLGAILLSLTVFGAAVWVGSEYIETFQNGFKFGNANVLKVVNQVPEFEDASGNVKRLDDLNVNRVKSEDFESDVSSASFTCGANLTASDETTSPIRGVTSVDVDQGGTGASAGISCTSTSINLEDKHQGSLIHVCVSTTWNGNDNEFKLVVNDVTNVSEVGSVDIVASTEPTEHCFTGSTATNTASINYEFEVNTGNNSTTLRVDDIRIEVVPSSIAAGDLKLEGNTLSSTTLNEMIVINANGTGTTMFEDVLQMDQKPTPAGNPPASDNYMYFKTDNILYSKDSSGTETRITARDLVEIATVRNEQTSGTNRGGLSSGSWTQAVLNTSMDDTGIVTLSSNRFTLQAGTYEIVARFSATDGCGGLRARIFNFTDTSVVREGTNAYSSTTALSPETVTSEVRAKITIASAKAYQLEYYTTNGGQGPLGLSTGGPEVFESVTIRKLD